MYHFLFLHFSFWTLILYPLRLVIKLQSRNGPEAQPSSGITQVFVLRQMSILDVFVLQLALKKKVDANLIALRKRGNPKRRGATTEVLRTMIWEQAAQGKESIELVPVSVFWGRSHGVSKRWSALSFLFPDEGRATAFHKILMLILNFRSVSVWFGKPVDVGTYSKDCSNKLSAFVSAKRMQRALLIEFARNRKNALGPSLYSKAQLYRYILKSSEIEASRVGLSELEKKEIDRKVKRYIKEIAANYQPRFVDALKAILDIVWTRLFSGVRVYGFESVLNKVHGQQVIWLPCHRSNFDHLLLTYVLLSRGVAPPHTVAGKNLDFWPLGPFLRRTGSFFIRRSFAGNRLYAQVYALYIDFLLYSGFAVESFQEGSRSRTGKLLVPKTGMNSICVSSVLKRNAKRTWFVPVYFGYDRVGEDNTYAKELLGESKKPESLLMMVKNLPAVFHKYGWASVSFGEPILFEDAWTLFARRNGFSEDEVKVESLAERNPIVQAFVRHFSNEVNERLNAVAVLSDSALLASCLVTLGSGAVEVKHLETLLGCLYRIVDSLPRYTPFRSIVANRSERPASVALEMAFKDGWLKSERNFNYCTRTSRMKLSAWWYRGTAFHIIALPGLVADALLASPQGRASIDELSCALERRRQMWAQELFWPSEWRSSELVAGCVAAFEHLGFVSRSTDAVAIEFDKKEVMSFFSALVKPEKDVYEFLLAAARENEGGVARDAILSQALSLHRDALLSGGCKTPAFLSRAYGKQALDNLIARGFLQRTQGNTIRIATS